MTELVSLKNTETLPTNVHNIEDFDMTITESALEALQTAAKEEGCLFIRIGVKGGGCSGFQYTLNFISENDIDKEEDETSYLSGLVLVMDVYSKEYLKGTTLNHIVSLQESGFKFENPNSKKTCGCGSSFSV